MNDKEVTENLIEDKKPQKSKKNRTLIILVIIIGLIIIAGGSVYGYNYYKSSQFSKNLELAKNYIDDGDYSSAVIAYEDAIKINDKDSEAYEGLATAALLNEDYQKAQVAYDKLYELTSEPRYIYLASITDKGNTIGNLSNGGFLTEQGTDTYLIDYKENSSLLYKLNDEQNLLKTFNNSSPLDLNVFGPNIAFINNGDLKLVNSFSGDNENDNFQLENINYFQVYKDKLYYIQTQDNRSQIYRSNLDGSNIENILPATYGHYSYFYITDNFIYLFRDNSSGDYYYIDKVNLNTKEDEGSLYSQHEGQSYISSVTANSDKIYFTTVDSRDKKTYKPSKSIGISDLTKKDEPTSFKYMEKPVYAVNSNDDYLFYASNGILYRTDLNGENEEEIGTFDLEEGSQICQLAITSNYLYLRISDYSSFDNRLNATKSLYRTSLDEFNLEKFELTD